MTITIANQTLTATVCPKCHCKHWPAKSVENCIAWHERESAGLVDTYTKKRRRMAAQAGALHEYISSEHCSRCRATYQRRIRGKKKHSNRAQEFGESVG